MNSKIQKLRAERDKNAEKIQKLETRNEELEGQIWELENASIVTLVRDIGITPCELAVLLQTLKDEEKKEESTHEE